MTMNIICQIFRSPNEDGMYLYVKKAEGLSRVPPELIELFGVPQSAMVLVLSKEKKLARVTVEQVIESLEAKGYYLQMPVRAVHDQEMQRIRALNDKLSGQ